RLRFSGPKTSIICSPMTSLKTSIKTITYLSDTGCLEIQGASLITSMPIEIVKSFVFIKISFNNICSWTSPLKRQIVDVS
ncbi:hypothetical protein, partial [Escherichia coli]|uniref:hypothetical protein n=1 Tax=Escherichia coli TaxID=562 RepID=UPI003D9B6AFC